MLAVDLCRNENGVSFLNHKTDYTESNETTASIHRELKREVKTYWKQSQADKKIKVKKNSSGTKMYYYGNTMVSFACFFSHLLHREG